MNKTDPSMVGLSQERLDRITKWMEENVGAGRVAGTVAAIAREGELAYIEARGMADTEAQIPMEEDTIFRIYSMSKPITSVALMMLYEEGKVKLKDPVSKHIPELGGLDVLVEDLHDHDYGMDALAQNSAGDPAPPYDNEKYEIVPSDRDMTVQDLLRHTAGLSYGFYPGPHVDRMYVDKRVLYYKQTLADMVKILGETPLKHHPGTTWEYSIATDVVGRLVEVLSGMPFDEYLEERIFNPLDMVDTAFFVPDEKKPRFAQLYSQSDSGGLEPAKPGVSKPYGAKPALFSGGGGLVSTVPDYLSFCQMIMNGGESGGVRLLSRKTLELMTENHLNDSFKGLGTRGYGFGLGFAVAEDHTLSGLAGSEGEFYWGGAAGTGFWIDPEEDFIGLYMVQIMPHTGLTFREDFKQLAYQTIDD